MAAKLKSVYICSSCGYESAKWNGRCPSCGEWNTFEEEVVEAAPLSFASIKYHREVPMGQSVQVFYAPSKEGWYVLGRREEHAAF